MTLQSRWILPIMATSIAACAVAPTPGGNATPSAATRPSPPAPVLDAPAVLPADFVVSTNAPFWQARVQGFEVLLAGPSAERIFRIEMNDAVFDGRYVLARDASGTLETRIASRLCQDSMSGAVSPYTARLTIDGGAPVLGCARGLGDPPPAEPGP